MCQYLPTGKFLEIEVTEMKKNVSFKSILDTKSDHKYAYFIKRHLEFPQNKHGKLNIFHFVLREKEKN